MDAVTLPLALVAGVVSFASPCFLPIVPVYVGYLAGGDPHAGTPARRTTLAQASAFVLGFSLVFVGVWASIGVVGYALGEYRSWLRVVGGAVLIVMGLHVAGLIEIPVLHRTLRAGGGSLRASGASAATPGHGLGAPSLRRSGLLGLAFGAGWTPCIGPILGGVIGLASVSGTVGQGAVLLAAYCVGLGLPFVLVALGAQEIHRRLGVLRRHETAVALTSGALLVAAGFLIVTDLFARVSGLFPTVGL